MMHFLSSILVALFAICSIVVASPFANVGSIEEQQEVRPRAPAVTSRPNPASAFIASLCTKRSLLFPPRVLSSASLFCTSYLHISPATVIVSTTSTSTNTISQSTTTTLTELTTTTTTEYVDPPRSTTTTTITETPAAVIEIKTAPTPLATITSTVTIPFVTTTYIATATATKTRYYEKREAKEKRGLGLFASCAASVVSSACKCIATTPTVSTTKTIIAPTDVYKTLTSTQETVAVETVTTTEYNPAVTTTVSTTLTLPPGTTTTTITPPVSTLTSTVQVTSTNIVSTTTTTTITVQATPTSSYTLAYQGSSCCVNQYIQFIDWYKEECGLTETQLTTDCQARCDANPNCKMAAVVNYGGCDWSCVLNSGMPTGPAGIQSPCYGPCKLYTKP